VLSSALEVAASDSTPSPKSESFTLPSLPVVWCGAVWCGAVWCGVVWCGVVRCGVMWHGTVRCGVARCGVGRQGSADGARVRSTRAHPVLLMPRARRRDPGHT
jgi:hypothetical protein